MADRRKTAANKEERNVPFVYYLPPNKLFTKYVCEGKTAQK